jgi:DNA-binding response OmpR family regulator
MRVLLVEDEKSLTRYLKKGLEEEGYAVDVVADGQDAVNSMGMTSFDVVVLDVMIPTIDGFKVCRRIRERGQTAAVIMLTARDTLEDRVNGLDAGADDYLVKPFAFEELLARIRAVSRRSRDVPRSPVLTIADLSLNTVSKIVSRGSVKIELPHKEHALLECLMREPDRVFSRELIAEHIWDSHSFTESNVVDVYIRNLRRRIDDPFSLKLIHTVRGMGYKISDQGHHEAS